MLLFRIRNIKSGLYSAGGYNPSFTKKGKIWHGRGPFHGHLALVGDRAKKAYADCVVEIISIEDNPTCTVKFSDYLLINR